MSDEQWEEFWKALDDLWPGKLTEAQAAIWKSRVLCLPMSEALAALNDYYSGDKKPRDGPIPSLCGFLRRVRTQGEDRHMKKGGGATNPGWHEILREAWIAVEPSRSAEFAAMSKNDILLRQYQWQHEQSCNVYGKISRGATSSYWKWQAQLYLMDLRGDYPGRPANDKDKWLALSRWSYGAEVRYYLEIGEHEEAKRAAEAYKLMAQMAG